MKKRLISLILTIVMVISMLPTAVFATDVTDTVFSALENKATVTYSNEGSGFTGTDGEEFIETTKDDITCIKSNSYDMNSSKVHTNITISDDIDFGILSFDYIVSSEAGYSFYDGLSVKLNSETLKEICSNTQTEWETMEIPVSAGDIVTVSYVKDSGDKGGDDCVYLKDFQFAALNTLTFDVSPSNAKIVLTDSKSNEVDPTDTDNIYALVNGTYDYEISAFGYESEIGSVIVNGDDNKTVELTQKTSYAVDFNVTLPDGFAETQTIVVKHDGDEITTETAGSYSLVPAEYTYEITHDRCETVKGEFEVTDQAQDIDVELFRKWVVADYFAQMTEITAIAGEDYGFILDEDDDSVLMSNNASQKNSSAILNLTVSEPKRLTFEYKVPSYDYYDELTITKGSEELLSEDGNVSSWTEFVCDLAANESIEICYAYDGYSAGNTHTFLKNFTLTDVYALDFTDVTEGATIVLTDSDENEISGENGSYLVEAGTYNYEISKFGYTSKTGAIEITNDGVSIDGTLTKSESYKITFDVSLPDGLSDDDIETVVKFGSKVMIANDDGTYSLPNGTYTYEITHPNCDKITGEVTLNGADQPITKEMVRKKVFSDFFADIVGIEAETNANLGFEPAKDGEDDVLASNSQGKDASATMTLTATNGGMLSFDYKVSAESGCDGLELYHNGSKVLTKYGTAAWTNYSVMLATNDTLEIKYYKDYSTAGGEDTVWVKNFAFEKVATVNFTNVLNGAVFTLKNSENTVMTGTDYAYDLVEGKYTYTLTKFGFEPMSGTVTVTEADRTINLDNMVALETFNLSFETEDDATIVVKYGTETMTAIDGVYSLPTGSYSYEIAKPNYISVSGVVNLTKDTAITAELVFAGEAWNGSAKTEPETDVDGIYQIKLGSDLAWFADQIEKNTNKEICGILTQDINLNSQTWNSIGSYSFTFEGTLDGDGYTISGLTSPLFDTIGTAGTVKNLVVNGNISGTGSIGGVSSTNNGTISNCAFYGSVTNTSAFSSPATAGISGRTSNANAVIENCANYGSISNSHNPISTTDMNVAGIVGYTSATVRNCYNMGTISASTETGDRIGGIAGAVYASGTVSNVYNFGSVIGHQAAAIVCENYGTVTNAYYIDNGVDGFAENTGAATSEAKTVDYMQSNSFVLALGDGFNIDSDNINGGYPVLDWQGGSAPALSEDAQNVLDAKDALELSDLPTINTDSKYHIKEEITISLPTTGINDTTISWVSDSDLINTETGVITLASSGEQQAKLTATISKGNESETKDFDFVIWSNDAQYQAILDEIDGIFASSNETIQPLQAYSHINVTDAMVRWLDIKSYPVNQVWDTQADDKITVSFSSNGGNDSYISETGVVTYYTGQGVLLTHERCNDVVLTLSLGGITKNVELDVNIGWDETTVLAKLNDAIESLTWDDIKGENTNTATETPDDYNRTNVVSGEVSENLILPYSLEGYPEVTIKWGSRDTEAMTIQDNEDGTYTAYLNRPLKGQDAKDFMLTAIATFNRLDTYMIGEATNSSTGEIVDWYQSTKNFEFAIAAEETDDTGIQTALDEKFEGLLTDYITDEVIDINKVDGDFSFPTPSELETAGIFTDRANQKVTFTSDNEDLVKINSYRTFVYRPMAYESEQTANVTVTITERGSEKVLGEKTIEVTVLPITQTEIDDAKDMMEQVATEDVYWNGIKGENTDKNAVTEDLTNFTEIHIEENGDITYIRGIVNATYEGIDVDDLPGYDSMSGEQWREFRSSRPTVITHETLNVTQPQYNTVVTIESALTHNEFGKYYAKDNEKYAEFAEFYKQPISVDVTVTGTLGVTDPDQDTEITVKASIDGKDFAEFANIANADFTYDKTTDTSAWDVVLEMLTENNYTYDGSGSYISSVTDSNGVTLANGDFGVMSGWMYTINGEYSNQTLNLCYLKDGDIVELYYSGEEPADGREDWVAINTAEEWIALANAENSPVDSDPSVTHQTVLWAKKYYLTDDIDFSDISTDLSVKTKTIGKTEAPFTGEFDGNGYSIKGLTLSNHDSGLFGVIGETGYVHNITIDKANLLFSDNSAVLAHKNKGTISECAVIDVNINADTGSIIGGMVSRNYGTITKSYVQGGSLTSNSDSATGHAGFVGSNEAGGKISECWTSMDVTTQSKYAGGFVGWCYGDDYGDMDSATIEDCFALGNVTAGTYSGGFVGHVYYGGNDIKNCYAFGTINEGEGNNGFSADVNGGFMPPDLAEEISNCYYNSESLADDYATGKSLTEMQNVDFLVLLNADSDKWSQDTDKNNGLPYLTNVSVPTLGETEQITAQIAIATYNNETYEFEKMGEVIELTIESSGNTRVIDVLDEAVEQGKLTYAYDTTDTFGRYIKTINGYDVVSPDGWMFSINDALSNVSATLADVQDDDKIIWYEGTTKNLFVGPTWDELNGVQEVIWNDIATADQLVALVQSENLTGNYRLTADIDMADVEFTGIGNATTPFSGIFDGQNHKISNLTMSGTENTGLFGVIEGATIKNVVLENANVTGTQNVGTLVGYAKATLNTSDLAQNKANLIANCSATGVVTGKISVGGLVGFNEGQYDSETGFSIYSAVDNCSADVTVAGIGANTTLGYEIGGLIGSNEGYITNSSATGDVTADNSSMVGGLCGKAYGGIYDSFATGDVSANSYAGGFIGMGSADIEDCYSLGGVSAIQTHVGGFAGSFTGTIENSMSAGIVADTGAEYQGGFAGNLSATLIGVDNQITVKNTFANCHQDGETIKFVGNTSSFTSENERAALEAMTLADMTVTAEKLWEMFGVNPKISGDLSDEFDKYASTIVIGQDVLVGDEVSLLKSGETANADITATISGTSDYLNTDKTLKAQNLTAKTISEITELTLTDLSGNQVKKDITVYFKANEVATENLMDTIAQSYVDTKDAWAAMDMMVYETLDGKTHKLSDEAKQNILNLLITNVQSDTISLKDHTLVEIALSSMGIDSTKLYPANSNVSISNAKMLSDYTASQMTAGGYYDAPWILLSELQGQVTLTDEQRNALFGALEDNLSADGIYGYEWGEVYYPDIDTLAVAISALSQYEEQSALVDRMLTGAKNQIGYNGGFGSANTDAMMILAMLANGENPYELKNSDTGLSVVDSLLSEVNTETNKFMFWGYDNDLATEQAFRTLIALDKWNDGEVYQIYDFSQNEVVPGRATGAGEVVTPTDPPSENSDITVKVKIITDSKTWLNTKSVTIKDGSSVYHALVKALRDTGISETGASSGYVESMTKDGVTLGEFGSGANSGWLYKVNGTLYQVGILDYLLENGDSILWYYTEDWTEDEDASAGVNGGSIAKEEIKEENTDFSDVLDTDWYYEAVKYVAEKGLFNGVDGGKFAPNDNMTRSMVWTVLARHSKVDTTTGDDWYTVGMKWAIENDISDGTDLDGLVTREQLITMLWRYSGQEIIENSDVTKYADCSEVSTWARDAINWAYDKDILKGKTDELLAPNDNATRAEVATILMRYLEIEEK